METTVWCSAGQESQNQEHQAAAGGRPHRPSADHSARKFPRTKHLSEDLMRFILGSTCSLREFLTVAKLSLMLLLRTVGSVWARAPAVRCLYKFLLTKPLTCPVAVQQHVLMSYKTSTNDKHQKSSCMPTAKWLHSVPAVNSRAST